MTGILSRLEAAAPTLPDAERRVADHILRLGGRATELTVRDLARATNVSVASVSRLAKRIGCADYRELKLDLARDSASPATAVQEDIRAADTDEEIVRKILGADLRSLEDTVKMLNLADLTKAAKTIARCNQLVFLGCGSSGYIAQDAALRFAHLGLRTAGHLESIGMVVNTMNLDKDSVVCGISHSGRSAMTVQGMKIATQRGALTIGISNYTGSPLQDESRHFFCTAFRENQVRAVAISSRISQVFVLDLLYALVARHMKTLPDEKQVNGLIDANYRLPMRRRR